MVSKLEYVGEHSMMIFFKEQREHTGYRNAEFFKNLFLFNILLSFYNFIKIFLLYGNILTILISKLKSLEVLNHIQSISFLYSVRIPS